MPKAGDLSTLPTNNVGLSFDVRHDVNMKRNSREWYEWLLGLNLVNTAH